MYKYSIGLPLRVNKKHLKSFFKKEKNKLEEVYFSIITDIKFCSRKHIYMPYRKSEKRLISILRYLNKIGIKLNLVINSSTNFNEDDYIEARTFISKNNIVLSKITILDKDYHLAEKYFDLDNIKLSYSYNNNIRSYMFLDNIEGKRYDEIVVGNKSLRDIEMIKKISDAGMSPKILLNNGCTPGCSWCVRSRRTPLDKSCGEAMINAVNKMGKDRYIAHATIFPYEQLIYKKIAHNVTFKISSRSVTDIRILKRMLNGYHSISHIYNNDNIRLYNALGSSNKIKKSVNIETVLDIQKELWKESMNKCQI